ncbi:MAG TPA: hypothetical protein VIL88_17825 [Devosia sp.]|jgi:hypothetical protein|uniref:hypothetical protein n=1 Tax=Devosia sp. TaxID=1871048 RepID=UPI002F95E1A6
MRNLLAALGRMLSAMKTVWEWCGKTGRLVARTVVGTVTGAGAGSDAVTVDEPAAVIQAADNGLANLRRLAGAMAADRVTEADLANVPDGRIEWLAAMDRGMLARVMCADDATLQAHLRGQRSIRGVLAADADSVRAYRQRQEMSVDVTDAEPAPEMAYAA